MLTTNILSIGYYAQKLIKLKAQPWLILATFKHSIYLKSNTFIHAICIVHPKLGCGPLNIVLEQHYFEQMLWENANGIIDSKTSIFIENSLLHIANAKPIKLQQLSPWVAPKFVKPDFTILSQHVKKTLSYVLANYSPSGIFPNLFFHKTQIHLDFIENNIIKKVKYLQQMLPHWLADKQDCHTEQNIISILTSLVGLGRGLTPSGDDFIAGFFMALYSLGFDKKAMNLYVSLLPYINANTGIISASLLCCTMQGHGNEFLHEAIMQILLGSPLTALVHIQNMGHSSGWDMLSGILLVFQIVAQNNF